MKKISIVKAAFLCLFSATTTFGAGFALFEGSAASISDAAGATAKGGEPAAMFFNPAAITTLPGSQVQAGLSVVAPQAAIKGTNPYTGEKYKEEARNRVWPLPHAYYTRQIDDEFWFGLGFAPMFGLGSDFDDDWFGRYNNVYTEIVTMNITPVLAWKANDRFSFAVGMPVQYMDITMKQKIDAAGAAGLRKYNDPSPSPYDVFQEMNGDSVGIGINLGMTVKATDKINIGAAYHSRIKQEVEGDIDYTKPPAVAAMAPQFFNSTSASGEITLPDEIMTAITYDLTEKLTIGFGVTYTIWSTYDELRIKLDEPIMPGRSELVSEKDWNDAWRYTAGLTYKLDNEITLRASYTYDDSPLNAKTADYLVPADNRHIIAVGAGYSTGNWVFDGSYFFEIIEDMDVPGHVAGGVMPSEFTDGYAHCVGFSVTRKF